ncbi:hypothetical protein GWK47_019386 [Chionoecetes opilio]|uniref:Uncharacterized protein n=1 Tax=Chionoecetes opilio TaxID=41210 RepID=A0A8J4XU45_CHIOP|nr:hypothetical protein GWK47_019386 [Chionoecetes opilio]
MQSRMKYCRHKDHAGEDHTCGDKALCCCGCDGDTDASAPSLTDGVHSEVPGGERAISPSIDYVLASPGVARHGGANAAPHHSVTEGQPGPVLMCASYNLEEEEAQVCPEYRDDLCAVRSDDLDKTLLSRPTDLADDDLMELLGLTPHQCRDLREVEG